MAASQDRLLTEQIAYYRVRADEYDEWFLRQGRSVHGPDDHAAWHAEAIVSTPALGGFPRMLLPDASALELAAGTGVWTQRLAEHVRDLSADLATLGWLADVRETKRFFLCGSVMPIGQSG